MLGWALNKATGNASNTPPTPGPDDTFVDQPDTPAPVFAARAFKRALFGTPAAPPKEVPKGDTTTAVTKPDKKTFKPAVRETTVYESPSKPQGILLTPGTGATRRKRVSFGRDVKATNPALSENSDGAPRTRPKTKLLEALENARKQRDHRYSTEDDARKLDSEPEATNDDGDDVWEEVDELDRDAEGTVDLNDPRSQSGRYWKSEFQKYHEEAQAEMEKLVKYKQLAKSYAKAKDAEAMDLTQRLKEEQDKVAEMDHRTAELAGQLGAKYGKTSGQGEKELLKDLTRQTALAVQYRKKVDALETCLKNSGYDADGSKRPRGGQPTTGEHTKELSDLRQQLQRVKSELNALEERARRSDIEKRDLERKLSRKDSQYDSLKTEYDALKEKNRALREEVSSLKHTSHTGDADVRREDPKVASTGVSAPRSRAKRSDELQPLTLDREEIRRPEMEDASLTINLIQQEFKKTAEVKSSAQRKASAESRVRLGRAPKFGDDAQDLLRYRPISAIKRSATPSSRSINRGSKRTVSGRVMDKKSEPVGLVYTRATPRRSDTPRTGDLPRLSSKSRLGLVTERALNGEPDPGVNFNSAPSSSRNVSTRASLASDRRVAAIARLDQKRAERRKAREGSVIPGKENLGL